MKKRIITVVGKDSIGITAKVCVYLAENSVNILDIAQTIVGGYFNMMMVVDIPRRRNVRAPGPSRGPCGPSSWLFRPAPA